MAGYTAPYDPKHVSDFAPFPTALPIAVLVAALVPAATFGQRTTLVSPELHKDGSVTFRLERPGAHEVLVALAGLETPLKMTQTEGVWSVTSAPLELGDVLVLVPRRWQSRARPIERRCHPQLRIPE